MGKLPNNSNTGDDTGMSHNKDGPPSTPRWVKVSGIIAIAIILLIIIKIFIGGDHGPGRHISGGEPDQQIE